MKSLLTVCMMLVLFMAAPLVVHAENAISLFLDGKPLPTEVPPVLVEGNTLVPVRVIAENLGAKVAWDGNVRKVTVKDEAVSIEMTIDRPQVKVNNSDKLLEVPPKIIDGNTMLPVRFVSETMGVEVTWDDLTRSVFLYKPNNVLAQGKSEDKPENKPGDKPENMPGDKAADKPATSSSEVQTADNNPVKPAEPAVNPVKPANPANPSKPAGQGEAPTSTAPPGNDTPNSNSAVDAQSNPPVAANGSAGIALGSTVNVNVPSTGQTVPANPPTRNDPVVTNNAAIPDITAIQIVGDRIYIQSSASVGTPKVTALTNPDRLAIDIPGSELGTTINGQPAYQNGEISVSSKFTDKIRYSLFSDKPSTVRIVLDLKEKTQASPVQTNFPNQTVLQLKVNGKYKIVLDAGHGGHDSGAVSITGKFEKDFTLSMVKKVKALLEQVPGVEVLTTRIDDTFVELDDRAAFANNNKADVFVSIHGNNYTASTAGVETYYGRDDSIALANQIHPYMLAATGFPDRKVRQEDFRVVLKTTMPAVLLEVGYLSNPEEEAPMYTEAFQDRVAAAIVKALKNYLQIKP